MLSIQKVLHDWILCKRKPQEELKTLGGILLPDDRIELDQHCDVLAVGKHKTKKGDFPLDVKVGDKVLIHALGGLKIDPKDHNLIMIQPDDPDLLGLIK